MNISIEEKQKIEQDFLKKLIQKYKEFNCIKEGEDLSLIDTNEWCILNFLESYLVKDEEDYIPWNTSMDIIEEEIQEAA